MSRATAGAARRPVRACRHASRAGSAGQPATHAGMPGQPTRRRALAGLAAAAWAPLGAAAQPAGPAAAPGASAPVGASATGRLLRERLPHRTAALAAAVVDGAQVQLAAEAGADAGPVTPDTLFELGSVTKTFTALLLADAVVRGELALDDPVEAVLPDRLRLRDAAGAPITWADLATHRAGLPRLPDNLRDPSGADPYDYSRAELLAFIAGWRASARRDTAWAYSNLGYGLLAEALAMRAGQPYAELLRARVLQPLGLDGMALALRAPAVPGLVPGRDAQGRPVPNWRFDAIAGAGALVGSARQLARYAQAALGLFDHPLKPAFALAMQPRAEGPSAANRVALAWLAAPLFERQVLNHDGGTGGYASSLWLDPSRRRAALVLSRGALPVNDLALLLLEPRVPARDLAAERRQTERTSVALPAGQLAPLAGRYRLSPQFAVEVRARDGRLFAQATGQGEFELFALAPRQFFARVTPLEMRFEGEDGPPPAFVLQQGGQRLRFVRE